jgi:type I restriction enzyme S subunit
MGEFDDRKLKDIGCSFLSGYGFKSSDYTTSGIPLIKIGNIQNRIVTIDPEGDYLSEELLDEKVSQFLLNDNDVLIAMTGQGSVGRVGKLKLYNHKRPLLNQRVGKFICDEKNINIDYLYYILTSDRFQDYLFNTGSGSGQPNLSPDLILETEIPYTIYDEQCAIASILSSLDDKIDLLHRQNKTLEALAETLFRRWFVEEGTEIILIGNVASVTTGKGLKREEFIENGEFPILGANGEIGRTNKYLTESKLILTGRVGTLGKVYLSDGKVWISDNVLIVNPFNEKFFYPIYFTLKSIDFENLNVGSTQPLVTQTEVKKIEIKIPAEPRFEEFTKMSAYNFEKIKTNKIQIYTLIQLRDTLLPKLMSGEIRLNCDLCD